MKKKKKIAALIMCLAFLLDLSYPASVYASGIHDTIDSASQDIDHTISAREEFAAASVNNMQTDTDDVSSGPSTGTQQAAIEHITDVDEDIEDAVNALVGINWEYIEISNADELMELTEHCVLDTWSRNKHVILTDDISLLGRDFHGIPTFGGIFDGKGHTISEVFIDESVSYVGFFAYVQKDAVIRNLHISGSVAPSGRQVIVGGIAGDNSGVISRCSYEGIVAGNDYVGGIAGMNELTGHISDCSVSGYIRGVHFTGGIAGENMGNIIRCTNNAPVNTTNTDTTLDAEALGDLSKLMEALGRGDNDTDEAKAATTVTDSGGIAGLSIGIISYCVNHGSIGYEHVGYNTGGIAGRQSGYIYSCTNNGRVLGRKDVGGIAGQAEPYITIDFSSDIAYQLSEAIGKLHDLVNVTLSDTRNQSDVITGRLSVIQQYTSSAISDARYLAESTVDFANGVTGAATEAFSRVDYILAQSSMQDGLLDQTAYAYTNIGSAMESTRETVEDLELTQYMSPEDKAAYDEGKNTIEKATVQFKDYYSEAYKGYYNYYIWKHAGDNTATSDLQYKLSDGTYVYMNDTEGGVYYRNSTEPLGLSTEKTTIDYFSKSGDWVHHSEEGGDSEFPSTNSEVAWFDDDASLAEAASRQAAEWANNYALNRYSEENGTSYTDDIATASADVTRVIYKAMDVMSDEARGDAIDAVSALQAASSNLSTAGSQTKDMVSELASRGAITFPTLSADYRAHTTSLADNMQVMNDNFGLLNQEINNATIQLTDDLEAVSDQFNTIMLLYTDALDGVLERDYNSVFTDDSLSEAETSTDATLDTCFNYGEVDGDIGVAGIAGTMAIEYDYDLESDVTGIKDSELNTSYITKCVLRGNKNYADIKCVKSYAGGICGLQEMGTLINDENYAAISSDSGDYVGGIAGSSLSYIVDSFAKGSMSGNNYIGGITGDGTHIRNCVALVRLTADGSWCGAIAGHVSDDGEVRNNYYVSDDLAGIDRVSYSLKAEPITYDELMGAHENEFTVPSASDADIAEADADADIEETRESFIPKAPHDFEHLTVTFMLDDEDEDEAEQIGKLHVDYGKPLDMEQYPGVVPKDGFYVEWDKDTIKSVTTDETVTASYKRYLTTLADASLSDTAHYSEILIDGNFKEGDSLIVARSVGYDEDDKDTLSNYETIELMIPDDGADIHRIRFKPDTVFGDEVGDDFILRVYDNGDWKELTRTGQMGGYYTYDVQGSEVKLMLDVSGMEAKGIKNIIMYAAAGLIGVALIAVIIWAVTRRKSRKQIRRAVRHMKRGIKSRIDNKEQMFIPDDADTSAEEQETAKD